MIHKTYSRRSSNTGEKKEDLAVESMNNDLGNVSRVLFDNLQTEVGQDKGNEVEPSSLESGKDNGQRVEEELY